LRQAGQIDRLHRFQQALALLVIDAHGFLDPGGVGGPPGQAIVPNVRRR
jgi:hypothetical protein